MLYHIALDESFVFEHIAVDENFTCDFVNVFFIFLCFEFWPDPLLCKSH